MYKKKWLGQERKSVRKRAEKQRNWGTWQKTNSEEKEVWAHKIILSPNRQKEIRNPTPCPLPSHTLLLLLFSNILLSNNTGITQNWSLLFFCEIAKLNSQKSESTQINWLACLMLVHFSYIRMIKITHVCHWQDNFVPG